MQPITQRQVTTSRRQRHRPERFWKVTQLWNTFQHL